MKETRSPEHFPALLARLHHAMTRLALGRNGPWICTAINKRMFRFYITVLASCSQDTLFWPSGDALFLLLRISMTLSYRTCIGWRYLSKAFQFGYLLTARLARMIWMDGKNGLGFYANAMREQKGNEMMLHAKAMNPYEAYSTTPPWIPSFPFPMANSLGPQTRRRPDSI